MQVETIRMQQNHSCMTIITNFYGIFISYQNLFFVEKTTHLSAPSIPLFIAGQNFVKILAEKLILLLHLTFMKGEIMNSEKKWFVKELSV